MNVINRYFYKNLLLAFFFVTLALTFAVLMTQMLKFLELVVEAGANAVFFLTLLALSVPRLLDVVLPVALLAAVMFVYNKMMQDSEIVVLRAAGLSPRDLAKPALSLSVCVGIFLFFNGGWFAPMTQQKLIEKRKTVQSEFSNIVIREGVFNSVGDNTTVYARKKERNGELIGLLIHQVPKETGERPSTIIAERGRIIGGIEKPQVVVFNGIRQQRDLETGQITRLDFQSYTIDMAQKQETSLRDRWLEPGERTLTALMNVDETDGRDVRHQNLLQAEFHKRISASFLVLSFTAIALTALLAGNFDRRGQGKRILLAVICVVALQSMMLGLYNTAHKGWWFVVGIYLLSVAPLVWAVWFGLTDRMYGFSNALDRMRRRKAGGEVASS